MNPHINSTAYALRAAIETGSAEQTIHRQTQDLVYALGGYADISQMTTGAVSIYLISLMLSQPPQWPPQPKP